jgi:hypothetical protein
MERSPWGIPHSLLIDRREGRGTEHSPSFKGVLSREWSIPCLQEDERRGNGPFPLFKMIRRVGSEAFPGGNVPFSASFKARRVGNEAFPIP